MGNSLSRDRRALDEQRHFAKVVQAALRDSTIKTSDGRPLVLLQRFKSALEHADSSLLGSEAHDAHHSTREHHDGQIVNNPKILGVLAKINCLHLAESLLETGMTDSSLPMKYQDLELILKKTGTGHMSPARRFENVQWSFNAKVFELDGTDYFNTKELIAICQRKEINRSRTSIVYQVDIPEEFVGESIRNAIPGRRLQMHEICPGWCYRFALKTFLHPDIDIGERETETFALLRGSDSAQTNDGFVRHICAFSVEGDPAEEKKGIKGVGRRSESYNILMEYANVDLGEVFASQPPPHTRSEIHQFWKNILSISDAVSVLHKGIFETDNDGNRSHQRSKGSAAHGEYDLNILDLISYRYHHDIKASNILVIDQQFKLSDLGFAAFRPSYAGPIASSDFHGTVTYGPPECSSPKSLGADALQAFDMWSLGCLLSVGATWVALGSQGVHQFSKHRLIALETAQASSANGLVGDMFHDGTAVLAAVTDWHYHIRAVLRTIDFNTRGILDVVDHGLFVDIDKRIDADKLCSTLRCVVGTNEQPEKGNEATNAKP